MLQGARQRDAIEPDDAKCSLEPRKRRNGPYTAVMSASECVKCFLQLSGNIFWIVGRQHRQRDDICCTAADQPADVVSGMPTEISEPRRRPATAAGRDPVSG